MADKREPELKVIGCYFERGNGEYGFHFTGNKGINPYKLKNGDVFVYNKGILFKIGR